MNWLRLTLLHRRKIPPALRLFAALLTIGAAYWWWPSTINAIDRPPWSAIVVLVLAAVLYVAAEVVELFVVE
jgi:hypothetical protein